MKKKYAPLDSCKECRYLDFFKDKQNTKWMLCLNAEQIMNGNIWDNCVSQGCWPHFCPLEDVLENNKTVRK